MGHFGYFWPNYQHQFIWVWDLIGPQRIRNLAMVSVFRSLLNQLLILMHLSSISYFKSNYYRRSYIFLAVSKMVPFFTAEKKTPFLVLQKFFCPLLFCGGLPSAGTAPGAVLVRIAPRCTLSLLSNVIFSKFLSSHAIYLIG